MAHGTASVGRGHASLTPGPRTRHRSPRTVAPVRYSGWVWGARGLPIGDATRSRVHHYVRGERERARLHLPESGIPGAPFPSLTNVRTMGALLHLKAFHVLTMGIPCGHMGFSCSHMVSPHAGPNDVRGRVESVCGGGTLSCVANDGHVRLTMCMCAGRTMCGTDAMRGQADYGV